MSKESLTEKEEGLKDTLKFLQDNFDQLVRIKLLETDIEDFQEKIKKEYEKHKQTKKNEERNKKLNELCKENCQKAYEKYFYEKLQADMVKSKRNITISLDVIFNEIITVPGNFRISPYMSENRHIFHYKFDKIDEKSYGVTCEIQDSYFKIKGIYNVDNGFSFCE